MARNDSELLECLKDANEYWQLQQQISHSLSDGFFQLTLARKSKDASLSMRSNPEDMRFEMTPVARVTESSSSSSSSSTRRFELQRNKEVAEPIYLVSGGKIYHFLHINYLTLTITQHDDVLATGMPTKNLWNAKDHFVKSLDLLMSVANISCRINARSVHDSHAHTSIHNIESDKCSLCDSHSEDLYINQYEDMEGTNAYTETLSNDYAKNNGTLRNRNVRLTNNGTNDNGCDNNANTQIVRVVGTVLENAESVDKDGCICN